MRAGDENDAMVGHAVSEATGTRHQEEESKNDVVDEDVVVWDRATSGSST
jgi:hypothetical protein